MEVSVPYGKDRIILELDPSQQVVIVKPPPLTHDWIQLALSATIGSPTLAEIIKVGKPIAIITSDITRPCPSQRMLPPIIDELSRAGVKDEDITVVFAIGSHRSHTPEEQARLVGSDIYNRLRCVDFDPSDVVYIGTTTRGTPIEISRVVAEAEYRIALGNVEPHYFAGFTGGPKALMPGVCSHRTIQHNHAMMLDPKARVGILKRNPVREDIEEGASLIGIDFILNVVLDEAHKIAFAAAGHPIQAHRWACRASESFRKVQIKKLSDIVIVGAGGYPKDINLYQAHKALENAAMVVRPGGIIIWVAECLEGLGNQTFEEWLVGLDADEVIERIAKNFVLGGHKAAAIARILKHAQVSLVSRIPSEIVTASGMTPFSDVESAVHDAFKIIGTNAFITVIPDGASIIPSVIGTN